MKECKTCKESKALDEFHVARRGRLGRAAHCKACTNKAAQTKNNTPEGKAKKKANRDAFYAANPEYNSSYYKANKAAVDAANRAWKIANPDYMPQYLAQYLPEYDQRPERKEANRIKSANRREGMVGELPRDCLTRLIRRYGEACMNPECSREDSILTIDHVVPVSKGGLNVIENTQILCYTCNRRKGNRNQNDYRPD